jgi:cell division protein FtsX
MALNTDWRIIMRFALIGFVLGVVGSTTSLSSDTSAIAVTFLLCPAALLCAPLFAWAFEAAEFGTPGFYLLWALVALINAVLYALAGAAYVGLRKKPDRASTT